MDEKGSFAVLDFYVGFGNAGLEVEDGVAGEEARGVNWE